MKLILRFIYGKLDAIPEDRLHSLVLATDRLQVCPQPVLGAALMKTLQQLCRQDLTSSLLVTFRHFQAHWPFRVTCLACLKAWPFCAQVRQLMSRCLDRLKLCLTLDNFAETIVLADTVESQGLHADCVEFAL